jgi:hypothetical protein
MTSGDEVVESEWRLLFVPASIVVLAVALTAFFEIELSSLFGCYSDSSCGRLPPSRSSRPPPTSCDVLFDRPTTVITSERYSVVRSAAEAFKYYAKARCSGVCACGEGSPVSVYVAAYTDILTGTRRYNQWLSAERGNVVRSELERLGVPHCEINVQHGDDYLAEAVEANEAAAKKHRHATIKIVVMGAAKEREPDLGAAGLVLK